ncbi:MAG: PadR family transcriptional regulator [Acetatifactor sp.]
MLKHGILGLLSYYDRTGYEIMEVFKNSLSFMWNANTSQVYRELQNLKDSGFAEVTEIEQVGKPNRKVYSITAAGREELLQWAGDYENLKFPNSPILMKLFFGGMLPKDEAIAAIQKVKQSYCERGSELEQLMPRLDIYKAETENKDYAMFWDMTVDFGRGYARFVADWCDRCMEQIENSKEENR